MAVLQQPSTDLGSAGGAVKKQLRVSAENLVTIQLICDDGAMELRVLRGELASHVFKRVSLSVSTCRLHGVGVTSDAHARADRHNQ